MRAIVLTALGDADHLRIEERPDPHAGPGEAVVRLRAAALNRRDVWIRKGQYAGIKLPIILGSDGAGEVAEVGDGVDPSWTGRDVVIDPSFNWGPDERAQDSSFNILGLPVDRHIRGDGARARPRTFIPSPRTCRGKKLPRCRSRR